MATTADDVWQILAELAASQKQTQQNLHETERLFKEQGQELDRRFQETERRFRETDRRFQETERYIKRVSKDVGKLSNRLGEFVEWQVRPAVVGLFQDRGIDVHEFHPGVSVQREDGGLEIDLLVVNETQAILIEVKSKLTEKDVDEHLERLGKFKQFMPRYRDVKALGAVAAMVLSPEVVNYAYGKGLFVLAPSGETLVILNDANFCPNYW
jgi:hypothetical protein